MIPFNKTKEIELFLKVMGIVFVIGLITMFAWSSFKDYLYPSISYEQHVYEKVVRVVPYQSIARIELEDGTHCTLSNARNYLYKPMDLNYFLTIGDLIEKKANSDTLYIHRGSKEYFFVLGKFINKELNLN